MDHDVGTTIEIERWWRQGGRADADNHEVSQLAQNAPRRRCWLLYHALKSAPLEQALQLAQMADAFITNDTVIDGDVAHSIALGEAGEHHIEH